MAGFPTPPDHVSRRLLLAAVAITLATCIISQAMLQLGGGPRDEQLDLSDQLEDLDRTLVFDGLPPFISSAGVYYPERAVFEVGLSIAGLLIIGLGFVLAQRTENDLKKGEGTNIRRLFNLAGMLLAVFSGASLVIMTRHPMHTDLVAHLTYAMYVFYGSIAWAACATAARGRLDADLEWRGHSLVKMRWSLLTLAFLSLQITIGTIAFSSMLLSAFFEWVMLFSMQAVLLTFLPLFPAADAGGDSMSSGDVDGIEP